MVIGLETGRNFHTAILYIKFQPIIRQHLAGAIVVRTFVEALYTGRHGGGLQVTTKTDLLASRSRKLARMDDGGIDRLLVGFGAKGQAYVFAARAMATLAADAMW